MPPLSGIPSAMCLPTPRRALLAALLAAAAVRVVPASAATLSVQGSATFTAELMQDHRAEIEAVAGHGLRVVTNNSKAGLLALFEGTADLAMISTRLENEVEILRRHSPGLPLDRLHAFGVARLPVRLIVHPDNPVRAISFDDLRRVLQGEITNWGELGGRDVFIRVVATRDGAGVAATVAGRVIGRGAPITAPGQIRVQQGSQVATVVEQEPAALGLAQRKITRGRAVADLATAAPIEQELSLVALGEPTPEATAVIEAARAVADRVLGD